MDTTKIFANADSNEFDAAVTNLMEKNRTLAKEIRNIKIEQESQAILLCEVTEQKKKDMEDKVMIEDDKRVLTNILEERSSQVTRIANMQLETLDQMMIANHELNAKDIEITTLKLKNEQLKNEQLNNDLKREKEFVESFNKPSEAIKYFEQLMRSPRFNNDTSGLGYTSTKEGESSKSVE